MLNCVFDRTQEDVARARYLNNLGWKNMNSTDKSDWLSGLKGALNAFDLNRLESNIKLLYEIKSKPISIKSWTYNDNINDSEIARIIKNVQFLYIYYYVYDSTPELPNNLVGWQQWNDIEKILFDMYENYQENKKNRIYTGEIYAGGRIGVL